jgi:hypothetical protein
LDRLLNEDNLFKGAKALDETFTAAAFIASLIPAMAAGGCWCFGANIWGGSRPLCSIDHAAPTLLHITQHELEHTKFALTPAVPVRENLQSKL